MDALSFLKLLWRPTPIPTNPIIPNDTQSSFAETDDDPDENADSFFELDVASSDVDTKSCDSPKIPINADNDGGFVLKLHKSSSTPASPISILRSSPSFRGQMFGKSRAEERQKTGEETGDGNRAKKSARLFAVRLKVKEVAAGSPKRNNSDPKDGFMKYLKPFRVSHVSGASRRYEYGSGGDDMRFAACRFSPSSSPVAPPKKGKPESGFRVGYKNLGKSKPTISSSTAVNGGGRTGDSMAEQQESINGAILHCKKSYYHLE